MIDTQQQHINLNIRGEISIIVVQAHSGRKRDTVYAHKRTYTYSHIYEGGGGGGGGWGCEREHIHIYQVIHHQSARDTLSRC